MEALEVLHEAGICVLPTDTEMIAAHYGIKVVSYSSVCEIYEKDMAELYGISRHGYSFFDDGHYICAINENACGETRRRWTIAHELSHCLLGHVAGEERRHTPEEERAAECFAAELLAPLAVVNFCGVSSAGELMRLCRLSGQAAGIRFGELTARRREAARGIFSGQSGGASALGGSELRCVSDFSGFISRYLLERARRDANGRSFPQGRDRLIAVAPQNRMTVF